MNTCKHLTKTNSKPCDYYIKPGFCSRSDMFRCVEWMKKYEFSMSYSSYRDFDRCPRLYYYHNVAGIEKIIKDDPIKIGALVDGVLSGKTVAEMVAKGLFVESDISDNPMWLAKSMSIVNSIKELGLDKELETYEKQKEFRIDRDGIPKLHGFVDFSTSNHFCELKCSGRPDNYLDTYTIEDQVSTYFLSNPSYEYCVMLVIRVPELKLGKNEVFDYKKYYTRCYEDILRRPSHYFVGSSAGWGKKYYRQEFDLDALVNQIKWVVEDINKCLRFDYWPQRKSACFVPGVCDYLDVCKLGVVSEDKYRKREIKQQ